MRKRPVVQAVAVHAVAVVEAEDPRRIGRSRVFHRLSRNWMMRMSHSMTTTMDSEQD